MVHIMSAFSKDRFRGILWGSVNKVSCFSGHILNGYAGLLALSWIKTDEKTRGILHFPALISMHWHSNQDLHKAFLFHCFQPMAVISITSHLLHTLPDPLSSSSKKYVAWLLTCFVFLHFFIFVQNIMFRISSFALFKLLVSKLLHKFIHCFAFLVNIICPRGSATLTSRLCICSDYWVILISKWDVLRTLSKAVSVILTPSKAVSFLGIISHQGI